VHIIGHISPGSTCLKEWSANFYNIVNRYESTITGLFYGHTHQDSFTMFYENGAVIDPTHVAYIGPSVTPIDGRWPAFRIYTIDGNYQGSSYRVLDHETYVLDLDKANANDDLTWAFEYKAKEAYGLDSLVPAEWNKLIQRFIDDDNLFHTYFKYSQRAPHAPCDSRCKYDQLCGMRSGRTQDPQLCLGLNTLKTELEKADKSLEFIEEKYTSIESLVDRKFGIIPPECKK